jgi:ABC-type sugar transport system ATPase subunit
VRLEARCPFHNLTSATTKKYGSRKREERDLAQVGILRFENVAKSFGGTQALKGVSFDVNRGEVVALLGEKGSGISTRIKVLGGIVAADSGGVSIDGAPYCHRADPHKALPSFIRISASSSG